VKGAAASSFWGIATFSRGMTSPSSASRFGAYLQPPHTITRAVPQPLPIRARYREADAADRSEADVRTQEIRAILQGGERMSPTAAGYMLGCSPPQRCGNPLAHELSRAGAPFLGGVLRRATTGPVSSFTASMSAGAGAAAHERCLDDDLFACDPMFTE